MSAISFLGVRSPCHEPKVSNAMGTKILFLSSFSYVKSFLFSPKINCHMRFCLQQYSLLFLKKNSNSNLDFSENKLPFFKRRTKKFKIVLECLAIDRIKIHTIALCLACDFRDLGKFAVNNSVFSVICQARKNKKLQGKNHGKNHGIWKFDTKHSSYV